MINGKRKTAGGKIIRTKADLLEVKQYLPMVSQAVKDAYNKRMASFRDSADSVETIAAKYGYKLQNDAAFLQVGSDAPYKLPFAKVASLDVGIDQAKAKIKELPQLEKQLKQTVSLIEGMVAKFSPEDKKVAKQVKNQYNISSKIKGL